MNDGSPPSVRNARITASMSLPALFIPGEAQCEPGEFPGLVREALFGGGMLISVALLLFSIGLAVWAGENFYQQRHFIAATLILCSWVLLFLSWSAWGPWL